MAWGILAASGQLSADGLEEAEFLGELALSGEVRGVLFRDELWQFDRHALEGAARA